MTAALSDEFAAIIYYAAKAPSGHNAQQWKFAIDGNVVKIAPDRAKALPIVDPNNREMYISLGAALENLLVAAPHFGYAASAKKQNAQEIVVHLDKSPDAPKSELFFQIEKRQTNRRVYNGKIIPEAIVCELQNAPLEANNRVFCFAIGSQAAQTISEYVARGNEAQMNDAAFKQELLHWLRFNKGEAKSGDGLSYKVMGFPPTPRFLGRLIVGGFLKARKQNASDLKKINSSSHLAVFTTRRDSVTEWIDLGRSLQRFLLKATAFGIAHAYINQPCEIAGLANDLATKIPIDNEYPTIALRLGYAEKTPYSLRKNVKTVISRNR